MKYRLPNRCVAFLRFIPTLIIVALLTGCKQQTKTEKASEEEMAVLNQVFIHLVGTEWYYEKVPPPIPLSKQSTKSDSLTFKIDSIQYELRLKNRNIDSSGFKIYLSDTLRTYLSSERLERILTFQNFEDNFPIDTSWIRLIRKLNQINEPKKIDISQFNQTGRYTLVSESEYNDTTDKRRKIGIMTFSRVAFSETHERALFYYEFSCGRLCGWGCIVFVERKGDLWEVVGQREMWVS